MTFDEIDLDPRIKEILRGQGLETPTPVQEQGIPLALTERDLIMIAQTGTGKTLAYALPLLTKIAAGKIEKNMALVLVPTRELAVQVNQVITQFGHALRIRNTAIYGGVGMQPQIDALKKGSAVLVATPGRLLDHMSHGRIRMDDLMCLVLDEADRMLDMGFMPDITQIVRRLPENRQTIMCSATFPEEVERLAMRMLKNPDRVLVGPISRPVDQVRQMLYPVAPERKLELLLKLIKENNIDSCVIFMRTKDRTERVSKSLKAANLNAVAIHGDRSQKEREKALEGFREGKYTFLCATDVAARGLDIDGITHVINYDIPLNPEDYVHRIGRTARAKAEGDAFTLVCPTEHEALAGIEKILGRNLPRVEDESAPIVLSTWLPIEDRPKAVPRHRQTRSFFRRR